MADNIVLKVEHVSKKFCPQLQRSITYGVTDIARNMLGMGTKSERLRKGEFWAVDDVSFELRRGETLGLMGANGSGKSTILKMLNGIYMPDIGNIEIKGKVGALIEIGAGFHPMLSGRENIYVNGAILGMSKKEIGQKFDSIVDFADIGDFIDAPVKNYSSGMYVRLGFAVAVHCEPDILLIDEVLAVGDLAFQSKCYRKMADLRKKGCTIILVSHNIFSIRDTCERAILLQNGQLIDEGDSDKVISKYMGIAKIKEFEDSQRNESNTRTALEESKRPLQQTKCRIINVIFLDKSRRQINSLKSGEQVIIRIEYEAFEEIRNPIFGIDMYLKGQFYMGCYNNYDNFKITSIKGMGAIEIAFEGLYLPFGVYRTTAVISEDYAYNILDWHNQSYVLNVNRADNSRGLTSLPHQWALLNS